MRVGKGRREGWGCPVARAVYMRGRDERTGSDGHVSF